MYCLFDYFLGLFWVVLDLRAHKNRCKVTTFTRYIMYACEEFFVGHFAKYS